MMDNVDGIIENNEFTAIGQLVPNDNYGYDRLGSGISAAAAINSTCLLYTSPSPRDRTRSRMPSSA